MWQLIIAMMLAVMIIAMGDGVTCVSQATDTGHYTVTSCKIGGDAQKIFEELPQGENDDFDPNAERAIQVGKRQERDEVGVRGHRSQYRGVGVPIGMEPPEGGILERGAGQIEPPGNVSERHSLS